MVAQKNVSLVGCSFRNASAYPNIADDCIQQHRGDTDKPDHRYNKCPDIEQVDAGRRILCKGLTQDGIDCVVDGGDAAADGGRFILDVMGIEGLGAGDQTQRALNVKRDRQPQSDNPPQKNGNPFRRLFQHEPEQHHR